MLGSKMLSKIYVAGLIPLVLAHGDHSHGKILPDSFGTLLTKYVFPDSARYSSLLATLYISILPCVIIVAIPEFRKPKESWLLPLMVAFALGSLMGDVFVHLLPEIFHNKGEVNYMCQLINSIDDLKLSGLTENEKALLAASEMENCLSGENVTSRREANQVIILGFLIFVGFLIFMFIDKCLRILNFDTKSPLSGHSHSHSHSHTLPIITETKESESTGRSTAASLEMLDPAEQVLNKRKNGTSHGILDEVSDKVGEAEPQPSSLKVSAYLSLISGFAHNITDGFALASAFYKSKHMGITTAIAVLIHEIPHELGDFAILLTSGFSFSDAIKSHIFTTMGAIFGTICGCLINELSIKQENNDHQQTFIPEIGMIPLQEPKPALSSSDIMLPITAGGFIYISTVGVVPQLLQNTAGSKARETLKSLIQLVCILAGFGLMAWMGME